MTQDVQVKYNPEFLRQEKLSAKRRILPPANWTQI